MTSQYVTIDQAHELLAPINPALKKDTLRKAAEPDAAGRRKLPFFKDPLTNKLLIDRKILLDMYQQRQADALKAGAGRR